MRSENAAQQAGFVVLEVDEANAFAPVSARAFFLGGDALVARNLPLPVAPHA